MKYLVPKLGQLSGTLKRKKNSLSFPPDKDSLHHHLMRVNYITYCQKNYELMAHPIPLGKGWALINGKCPQIS